MSDKKIEEWLDLQGSAYGQESEYFFYDPSKLGISTLINLGNTCFFNSVLQCLSHTPGLVDFILQKPYPLTDSLWREFTNLIKVMKEKNYKLSPGDLYTRFAVEKRKYSHEQEDAHEILFFLLSHFHEKLVWPKKKFRDLNENHHDLIKSSVVAINQATKMSPINELFMGQFYQRVQCSSCKHINHNLGQTFTGLEMELTRTDNYVSIYDLFRSYCGKETMEDCYNCDNCHGKGLTVYKKITFFRLPKYLIITFKRFDFFHQVGHKNQKFIDYPLENLDLTKYLGYPDAPKQLYDLYAVVCHVGRSLQSGHYYSICKAQDNWVVLNDEHLSYVNKIDDIVTSQAYILFYRKKSFM